MKFAALVLLGVMAGCGTRPNAANLLPSSGEAPGWMLTRSPRTFAPGVLWQHLDGGAERYLQAGVQQTATAEYRFRNGLETSVDVHVFSQAASAAKTLSGEPDSGSRPAGIGERGRLYEDSLVFQSGRCLVRLTAFQRADESGAALAALARAVDARVRRHPSLAGPRAR